MENVLFFAPKSWGATHDPPPVQPLRFKMKAILAMARRGDMRLVIGEPVGFGEAVDQVLLGEDNIDLADSHQRQG